MRRKLQSLLTKNTKAFNRKDCEALAKNAKKNDPAFRGVYLKAGISLRWASGLRQALAFVGGLWLSCFLPFLASFAFLSDLCG
jgi:hypothetical protein